MLNIRPPSFLLLIGDDGCLLLPPSSHALAATLYADKGEREAEEAILNEIARDPRLPISILFDGYAQSYQHEVLPRLRWLDRRHLIKRRLAQAFPNACLKACVAMHGTEALLLGIDANDPLTSWLEKLAALPNRLTGIYALPFEAAEILPALMPQAKNGWAILLTHHKTGGYRQIITHHGKFVLTRLTPPIAETFTPSYIATSLAVEIKATRDYLARYGLTTDMPLQLIGIVPPKITQAMSLTPLDVSERLILSPHEAAQRLNLPQAPAPDESMGELVTALWFSTKHKARVKLLPKTLADKSKTETIKTYGLAAGILLLLLGFILLAAQLEEPWVRYKELMELENNLTTLEDMRQTMEASLEKDAKPLARLRKAAERRRLFDAPSPLPMASIEKLSAIIAPFGQLLTFDWSDTKLSFTLRFTLTAAPQDQALALLAELQKAFADSHVIVSKSPENDQAIALATYSIERRQP